MPALLEVSCKAFTHRVIVWLLLDELWRHVQRSALDGGQDHCVAGHCTSKAKITQLHNPVGTNQNVLRLHVTVNHAI